MRPDAHAHHPDRGHFVRVIVEHVGEGILVVDATSGRLIEANAALLRKLGYSAVEIRSLHVSEVLLESDESLPLGRLDKATTLARTTREVMQRGRDGSLVLVDDFGTGYSSLSYPGLLLRPSHEPRQMQRADARTGPQVILHGHGAAAHVRASRWQ